MPKIIFITGTDTGVGKTFVSVALVKELCKRGHRVAVFKPAETGCRQEDGKFIPEDAMKLWEASGKRQSLYDICPYCFETPLAPAVIAELEEKEIDLEYLTKKILAAKEQHDFVVVEGAGGLLVPLRENATFADFVPMLGAGILGAEVLVVVGSKLGAINHALLTFEVLQKRGIPILGYVYNEHLKPEISDDNFVAVSTNRKVIRRLAEHKGVSELSHFKYGESPEEGIGRVVERLGLRAPENIDYEI